MDGYGILPVPIRYYEENDKDQVRKFHCSNHKPKWHLQPQKLIRRAPFHLDDSLIEILVAHDGPDVVGVAVFEVTDVPSCFVLSLGVKRQRQNQGIGASLKRAVVVVAADRGLIVESHVHHQNSYMRLINKGLGAATEPLEDDPDYLATVVRGEVAQNEEDVTPSK